MSLVRYGHGDAHSRTVGTRLDLLGDTLAALSGILLLRELGAVGCRCRRQAREVLDPRGAPSDISLRWLPPFFLLSGAGGLVRGASACRLAVWAALPQGGRKALDSVWLLLGLLTALLELGAVLFCWGALRLANAGGVADEAALLPGTGAGQPAPAAGHVELGPPAQPEELRIFTPREGEAAAEAAAEAPAAGLFRVRVPGGWPGVQYRRSKNLDDRYKRYAENGTTVSGQLEDGGEWLRVGSNVFLPVRLGAVRFIEPLPYEQWPEDQE